MICIKSFYSSLSTLSPPLNNPQTTPSISMTNYSPPSSGNHRSLFVKLAKRGKQRAGVEAERCWCFGFVCLTLFYALLSTSSSLLNNPQTTPFISMANYSPPSSGNHRSLFVKPAKRGKQRVGGEALFPPFHSPNKKERSGMKMPDLLLYL